MGPGASARCPVCGADGQCCGPVTAGAPVDFENVTRMEPYVMADLKEYTYVADGFTVTARLTADDAKRLGATEVTAKAPASPVHVEAKARTEVHTAARTVPNKGR